MKLIIGDLTKPEQVVEGVTQITGLQNAVYIHHEGEPVNPVRIDHGTRWNLVFDGYEPIVGAE